MPKKKSGARKKAEKAAEHKEKSGREADISKVPCNAEMICDKCGKRQKNRMFCYFCGVQQRLPQCGHCGRTKCQSQTGDCAVKHSLPTMPATGISFIGCICDSCEAPICHSKRCIQKHTCPVPCPLENAICCECQRGVWDHGGRIFKCGTCRNWLCEDCEFEHQASCQIVIAESMKCSSCNKLGQYACLRCKICFCREHVSGKISRQSDTNSTTTVSTTSSNQQIGIATGAKKEAIPCKRCGFPVADISSLSMSTKQHEYGRHAHNNNEKTKEKGTQENQEEDDEENEENDEEDDAAAYEAFMNGNSGRNNDDVTDWAQLGARLDDNDDNQYDDNEEEEESDDDDDDDDEEEEEEDS